MPPIPPFSKTSEDKKPSGGLAIVIGDGSEPSAEERPGAVLSKDFLDDNFDSLKVGDTGTITLKFKVASKDEENGMLDFEFESVKSLDTTDTEQGKGTDDEDDMDARFDKHKADESDLEG